MPGLPGIASTLLAAEAALLLVLRLPWIASARLTAKAALLLMLRLTRVASLLALVLAGIAAALLPAKATLLLLPWVLARLGLPRVAALLPLCLSRVPALLACTERPAELRVSAQLQGLFDASQLWMAAAAPAYSTGAQMCADKAGDQAADWWRASIVQQLIRARKVVLVSSLTHDGAPG